MEPILSERLAKVRPSATLAINAKANALREQGKEIINLSAGEPDFNTPDFIKQAAIDAINDNFTRYTAIDGIPELKQAIINKLAKDNQLHYEPNQIIVSTGAKQALYNLTQAVINRGDEAIIPAPYWVSYPDMIHLAEGTPIIINTTAEQLFKITAEQLKAAITPKTRLLFLNSPNNPTGMAYSKDELVSLANGLTEHPQIVVVSDDIYEYILWEGEYCNIANTCPELKQQTIVFNGVSKAHAMTGWRIGYAAGDATIIAAMKKIQSQSTSNPTSISQKAAVAALSANKYDFFPPILKAFKERHDYIVPALNAIGFEVHPTNGAFYVLFNAEKIINALEFSDDLQLTEFFLEKAHVALVPGTAFGAPQHLRLSFATNLNTLQAAVERMTQAIDEYAK